MNRTGVLTYAATAVLAALGALMLLQRTSGPPVVTVDQARQLLSDDSTVVVLDVRTKEEYDGPSGHLRGAILIPIQELADRIGELQPFKEREILAYCRVGRRSEKAAILLTGKGFRAVTMEGGIVRWNEKEYPVVREKP